MATFDQLPEVRALESLERLYEGAVSLHRSLWDRSIAHRLTHGETCTVYPSWPTNAPLWPLLAAMLHAQRFLEVGTGLGYTTVLMAEAGGPTCHVDTIEAVPEHAELAEREFGVRGLDRRIRVMRGTARDVLPRLALPYDIVFLDADWDGYPALLSDLLRLTRPGGMIVTGNLFPLFEPWAQQLPGRDALEEYLRRLIQEPGVRTFVVPGWWKALSYRLRD
jgi:predicted O-methyltransferase YrrM